MADNSLNLFKYLNSLWKLHPKRTYRPVATDIGCFRLKGSIILNVIGRVTEFDEVQPCGLFLGRPPGYSSLPRIPLTIAGIWGNPTSMMIGMMTRGISERLRCISPKVNAEAVRETYGYMFSSLKINQLLVNLFVLTAKSCETYTLP